MKNSNDKLYRPLMKRQYEVSFNNVGFEVISLTELLELIDLRDWELIEIVNLSVGSDWKDQRMRVVRLEDVVDEPWYETNLET